MNIAMHNEKPDHDEFGHHVFHEDLEALETAKNLRYEPRDVDWNKIGKMINGFFIFTGVCCVLALLSLWGVQRFLANVKRPTPWEPLVDVARRVPDKSPLQNNVTAWTDIRDLRNKEHEQTQTYGVIDEAKGTYRIPVDRAMDMLAQSGLPAPTGAAGAAPVAVPTQTPVATGVAEER